jgi:hypothetical protein
MTDLFGRLARRALGSTAAMRPITPPIFAPPTSEPAAVADPEAVTPPVGPAATPSAAVAASEPSPARGDLRPQPGERLARPAVVGSPVPAGPPSRRRRSLAPEPATARWDRAPSVSRWVGEAEERPVPSGVAPSSLVPPTPKPRRDPTGEAETPSSPIGGVLGAVAESAPSAALAPTPPPDGGDRSNISPPRPRSARRDGRAPQDRLGESSSVAPPIIRVTIGRVEVRTAAPPQLIQLPKRQPTLSLDEYLTDRREGRR